MVMRVAAGRSRVHRQHGFRRAGFAMSTRAGTIATRRLNRTRLRLREDASFTASSRVPARRKEAGPIGERVIIPFTQNRYPGHN